MIEWYRDKDLGIYFNEKPSVRMKVIMPSMTDEEKARIKAFPFQNRKTLKVKLCDYLKNKEYEFIIPKMYCWDGATIPRMLWRLIGPKTSPEFLIPSMVHDWMCCYHASVGNDRNFSSRVFRGLLLEAGVGKIKAQTMYLAVDNFQRFCKWGKR